MGWIIAGVFGSGFCLLLGIRTFAYDSFCLPGELCLREWVSAVSGVLAVLAAFASLAYVAKQLEQANKHHRDAMRVQLLRSRAVARRAGKAAEALKERASRFVATWTQPQLRLRLIDQSGFALSQQVTELLAMVTDPAFGAFEEEVDLVAPLPVAQLRDAFKVQRKALETQISGFGFGAPALEHNAQEILEVAFQCVRYAHELVRLAEDFLKETEELVGN
jgi:hypothetical protein